MLKVGAVLVTVWSALNFLVAAFVTGATVLHHVPPALQLVMPDADPAKLDPTLLAVINAQAAFANPAIMAICSFVVIATWKGVLGGARWLVPAMAISLAPLQVFAFVSDHFLGEHNLVANVVSGLLLWVGLGLCFAGGRAR